MEQFEVAGRASGEFFVAIPGARVESIHPELWQLFRHHGRILTGIATKRRITVTWPIELRAKLKVGLGRSSIGH